MRKLAQNIYFKPYFYLPDTFLQPKNFIYALFRLAEKPAINFLKPAVSSKKKIRLGCLMTVLRYGDGPEVKPWGEAACIVTKPFGTVTVCIESRTGDSSKVAEPRRRCCKLDGASHYLATGRGITTNSQGPRKGQATQVVAQGLALVCMYVCMQVCMYVMCCVFSDLINTLSSC